MTQSHPHQRKIIVQSQPEARDPPKLPWLGLEQGNERRVPDLPQLPSGPGFVSLGALGHPSPTHWLALGPATHRQEAAGFCLTTAMTAALIYQITLLPNPNSNSEIKRKNKQKSSIGTMVGAGRSGQLPEAGVS